MSAVIEIWLTIFQVILRYLKKVEVVSDFATNGLEGSEMVLSKPQGFYSLIIVSAASDYPRLANTSVVRHTNADQEWI